MPVSTHQAPGLAFPPPRPSLGFSPWPVPAPQPQNESCSRCVSRGQTHSAHMRRMFTGAIALIMQISPRLNNFKALKIRNGIFKRSGPAILPHKPMVQDPEALPSPGMGLRHLCFPVPVHLLSHWERNPGTWKGAVISAYIYIYIFMFNSTVL